MNTFRENLKLQISYAGMTGKELAHLSGVKKTTIDSYLSNRVRRPSAEAATRLAQALGISVEHLFSAAPARPGGAGRTELLASSDTLVGEAGKTAIRLQCSVTINSCCINVKV